MFKRDLALSREHDLKIENFDLKLTDNNEIVAQRIKQALLLFKGEWFLDVDLGTPYYESILGHKNSLDTVRAIFVSEVQRVEGVKEVVKMEINLNNANRTASINLAVIDETNNEIEVNL